MQKPAGHSVSRIAAVAVLLDRFHIELRRLLRGNHFRCGDSRA